MRIWLDDVRPMPDGFDCWAKNAYYCVGLIITGEIDHISFDHDLGLYADEKDENNTGYRVAKFIEETASNEHETWLKPIKWDIHSANPVGRKNIEMAMKKAHFFWENR